MSEAKPNLFSGKRIYPLSVSIPMIAIAIIVSLVDLTFLNDVIGKVLDIGSLESIAIAFALGLVGIVIMAHQGVKAAHGAESRMSAIVHYTLWILLGLAFVLIRLFSATIMELDTASGDQSLITVLGLNIRQIDFVLAPLMLILYFATGLMVKDGVKNLLLNPEFENGLAKWKADRLQKKLENSKREKKAEDRVNKQRDEAEREREKRGKEIEEARRKAKEQEESKRVKDALNGTYSNALAQFRDKEQEIKEIHQKISANNDYVRNIDKQEKEFEVKTKPALLHIVDESIKSTQSNVALKMRNKTGEDMVRLRNAIDSHNSNRHE